MKRKINNLEDIKKLLKELQPELARKYKIKEIGIFASWIKGEQKRKSNLDILVEFEENAEISLFDFIEIREYLSKKIDVKVDLVEKSIEALYSKNHIKRSILFMKQEIRSYLKEIEV